MAFTDLPDLADGADVTPDMWTAFTGDNFAAAPSGLAQAKGDMFVGEGPFQAVRLPAGDDGQVIERDTSVDGGMKNSWAFVPIGGIIMWSGLVGSIPFNYQLCDGTNGTPNLRDQFVVGAGSTYAVGASGGSAAANLQHNHTEVVSDSGSHSHTQGATGAGSSHTHSATTSGPSATVNTTDGAGNTPADDTHTHSKSTDAEAAHTHSNPNTDASAHNHTTTSDNQLSSSQSMLPSYYALAFIMRIS